MRPIATSVVAWPVCLSVCLCVCLYVGWRFQFNRFVRSPVQNENRKLDQMQIIDQILYLEVFLPLSLCLSEPNYACESRLAVDFLTPDFSLIGLCLSLIHI